MSTARPPRVRAPELPGAGADWFNSAPLTLAQLRGRFVLLDFWTFCCANCLHVLDELRPLEREFADVLTVIGVHSPKFAHERDPRALAAAVQRYEVHHPVVNDPQLRLWRQYAVRAWPTLVLIDPAGYVVAQAAGEGQASALRALLSSLRAEHQAGTLQQPGPSPTEVGTAPELPLRFPAKAVVLPAGRNGRTADTLLVADAGHHQLVELASDGETVLRRIGTGARGHADGAAAEFAEPNGLALLPPGRAPYDLLVADTASHVLRTVRLKTGEVGTLDLPAALAGTRTVTGPVPGVLSPWDVAWWPAIDRAVVAAAGVHLLLSVDVDTESVDVLAGTTVEGLRDGPARDGWLAQPSGLAVDGGRLWFVDAETSALRYLSSAGGSGGPAAGGDDVLHTVVGEGLFDCGHLDGPAGQARLQHPLGVTLLPDGALAISDTYNGAVRRYSPARKGTPTSGEVSTIARDLAEPSGAVLLGGELYVVESAAHRLVRVPITEAVQVDGAAQRTERPAAAVRAGTVALQVAFTPAPGRKLDERYGPSTALTVSASPPELLIAGSGDSTELARTLTLAAGSGVLHVTAQAASCDTGGEHPACYLARQDWGVPLTVGDAGDEELQLVLLG